METLALQPALELSTNTENSKVAELMQKANERWWKMQVFLGKNVMTKMLATEAIGTVVDIGLMESGFNDPLTREPMAATVDYAVLHKLSSAHESEAGHEDSKSDRIKKRLGMAAMLGVAIAGQKAGLAVAEHAGLAHGYNNGVQIGSKYAALGLYNGTSALKQRTR